MVSFKNRILKAPYLFLLEVFHNLLEAFVFLKIAELNIQKQLDERNKINTDNLMWMTLHVDLPFMACFVSTLENPITAQSGE